MMKETNEQKENAHPPKKNQLSIISVVIGLTAVGVLFFEMYIAIIIGLTGLVLGILSLRRRQKWAWVGIVINGIIVVVPLIMILYLLIEILFLYSKI
jgi:hypothetical protein